jgi:hypothetical protein
MHYVRMDFDNALTKLINSEKPLPFVSFLMHPDLATSASREAPALIAYLRRKDSARDDGGPYLHTLADWALTDKWFVEADKCRWLLHQPCRNAAALLSPPFRRLWILLNEERRENREYVFRQLLEFPGTLFAKDRVFAGHYERILEAFIRQSTDWIPDLDAFLKNVIEFAVSHVDILAYQQFLSHLPLDFGGVLSDVTEWDLGSDSPAADDQGDWVPFVGFFRLVLMGAVQECAAIRDILEQHPSLDIAPPRSTTELCTYARTRKRGLMAMPLHLLHPTDPPTPWCRDDIEFKTRLSARRSRFGLPVATVCDLDSDGAESALKLHKTRAYLLISSVQSVVIESPEFIGDIRRSQQLFELLLFCGLYADSHSMVAPAAFRLLELLIYGDATLEVAPVGTEFASLVQGYAPDMKFTTALTAKMVAAFPIFWNEPILGSPAAERDRLEVDLIPREQDTRRPVPTWVGVPPEHPTPLALYGRFLVEDPPLRQTLCVKILKVLRSYHDKRATICDTIPEPNGDSSTDEEYYEYQRKVLDFDWPYFIFLTEKFPYAWDRNLHDLSLVYEVFPQRSIRELGEEDDEKGKARVIVNGALVEFAEFMTNASFFQFVQDLGPLFELAPKPPESDPLLVEDILEYNSMIEKYERVVMTDGTPQDIEIEVAEGDEFPKDGRARRSFRGEK